MNRTYRNTAHLRRLFYSVFLVCASISLTSCVTPRIFCHNTVEFKGDLILSSQADFQALASGPMISRVTGNIRISDAEDGSYTVTDSDMALLSCLNSVEGNLTIGPTANVTTLRFGGLRTVSGNLVLTRNSALSEADYSIIESVGGFLTLFANSFEEIRLESLNSVGRSLSVQSQTDLPRFIAPALVSVGENIFIQDNPPLELIIMDALLEAERITIMGNTRLRGLSMQNLVEAGDGIDILNNPNLRDIGLQRLKFVRTRPLRINQPLISELDFDRLERLEGGFVFVANRAMATLSFPILTFLGNELIIMDSRALRSIAMPNANSGAGTEISIVGNEALEEVLFPGFTASGPVAVVNNEQLVTIRFPVLTHSGPIIVSSNPVLESVDLSGLAEMNTVDSQGGDFRVESNDILNVLDVGQLNAIDGNFVITGNPLLNSCDMMLHAAHVSKTGSVIEDNDDSGMAGYLVAEDQSSLDEFTGTRCAENILIGSISSPPPFIFSNFDGLANIESVLNDLSLFGVGVIVDDIGMPSIRYVGDALQIHGMDYEGTTGRWRLHMENLTSANDIVITRNDELTNFTAPNLWQVRNLFWLNRMNALQNVRVPSLVRIDTLRISCNPRLDPQNIANIIAQLDPANPPVQTICGISGYPACTVAVHDLTCD